MEPHSNRSEGFHRTFPSVLAETFPTTNETCMRTKTVPLHDAAPTTSAAAHLSHEANQPYLWHETCHHCSWASFMTVCLPFFPSHFLRCLLAHIPGCTTSWQPILIVPLLPLHLLASTVAKQREAARWDWSDLKPSEMLFWASVSSL